MATLNFNAETVQPYEDSVVVPAGEYVACVIESELKITKNGNGQYLALTLSILEGPYANLPLWDRITLSNPNPRAVEIGQRQLSGLCHAVGVLNVQDSAQLHNIPALVKVAIRDDPQYPGNEIKSYKAISAAQPTQPKPQAQAPAPWAPQNAPRTTAAYPGQGPAPWAAKKPASATAAPTAGVNDDIQF